MTDPADKVALVTGGSSGIGLAICKELLQNKVKGVAICDIDSENGERVLQELEEKYGPGRVIFIPVDVRNYQQFEEAFQRTIETFGTLDIVVNNAGIFDDAHWEKEVDINLNGVIRGLLLAFQYMGEKKRKKGGVVVNIASTSGLDPEEPAPIYSGIKHGVLGLTKAFGLPYHFDITGVRVMALCPGLTDSAIFNELPRRLLREEWSDVLKSAIDKYRMQKPESVAKGMIHLIEKGSSGSVWVAEDGEPVYEVRIPDRGTLKVE